MTMLPDGHVPDHEAWLVELVEAALPSESVCLATGAVDALALTPAEVTLKRSAVACHRRRLDPPHPGGSAVLSFFLLDRLVTNREMLLL